jgi:hypothetical protein
MSVCSRLGQDLLRQKPQPTVSDVIQKTAGRIARSIANLGIVRVDEFAKPSRLKIFNELSLFHRRTVSQPEEIAKAIFSVRMTWHISPRQNQSQKRKTAPGKGAAFLILHSDLSDL